MKVPYMLVVGEKEMMEGKVSVRRQGKGDVGNRGLEELIPELLAEIKERRNG
jgi:threonyl-tRNA synthetase